jgi:adenylylsulfate kinase-like enzyme
MKKLKINQKKGVLFWITGLSGSGKTTLAGKIQKSLEIKYGPFLNISGDDLRAAFNYSKFDKKTRYKYAHTYSKFCKILTDKNINVIFSTVSMFHKVRAWNKNNIKNYFEIYIKTEIGRLIKLKKKTFYKRKNKNIVGKDIKAELPINSDVIIENNFNKTINSLKKELIYKIKNKIR